MTTIIDGTTGITTDGLIVGVEKAQLIKLETAQATTSGTSINFTGIPTWAKKITVMFNGVSLNASAHVLIQIGLSAVETTGYVSGSGLMGNGSASTVNASTAGFIISSGSASNVITGSAILNTLGSNVWVSQSTFYSNNTSTGAGGGAKTTSGVIDRLRITTSNGTDTFDAGSVNILIEGSL